MHHVQQMAEQLRASSAIVLSLILLLSLSETQSKLLTRCQLAKELLRHDFPRSYLSNWVCLVESESGRSTSKSMQLPNQSVSYGLFQINSKNWCRKGRRGGICNIKCEEFLNDEISDDSRCAMQIFNRHGFQAWPGWMSKCRGRTLPDVSRC
ncbi:lysozyme [Drosophila grimshawi]|nr:lysozyme [Drosophila grimshawi]